MADIRIMKAQAKKAARSASASIGRRTKFSVPMTARSTSPNNNICSPVGSGGGSYGGQREARGGNEYLMFVVQRFDGQWGYVRVNNHCLDVTNEPCVFEEHHAQDMLELWKRVVIDNAIPWEDGIRPDTLRIVRYKPSMEDATLSLFSDDHEVQEFMRMSALAKLSDAEARLLGLTHVKVKQKIMHNPNFDKDDKRMLADLMKESARLPLSVQLSALHD
jgi:hypothetical protein